MRRLVALVLVIAFHDAGAQAATPGPFAPLEFLVGSCWKGTFPDGKVTDEHCFEWAYDRKFIRDRHVVRGGDPYSGETLYFWDPKARQIMFNYYSSAGFVLTGSAEDSPEGVVFPSRQKTAAGEVEMRSVWTRAGADGYHVLNAQKDGTGWKTMWTMEMTRTR